MNTTTDTSTTYTFVDDSLISLTLSNHSGDVALFHDAAPGTAEVVLQAARPVDFEPVTARCQGGRVTVEVPALLTSDESRGFGFALGSVSIGVGNERIHVEVHLPERADVLVRTREGDIVVQGYSGDTQLQSGSGDIRADDTARLRAATGSGDVWIGRCQGGALTSGSGDICVDVAAGPDTLQARTGSGDVRLTDNQRDATIVTGSGDVMVGHQRGELNARTGTGDVTVAIPRAVPVWVDLSSGLGDVRRDIERVGEPADGQEHLRLVLRTGTGDIHLHH